jgi:hypothetical protein
LGRQGLPTATRNGLLGLRRRQIFRLPRGLKQRGATSVLSKRRGKPSSNRCPTEVRALALSPIRERCPDFGPTLAAEKSSEHHGAVHARNDIARHGAGDMTDRVIHEGVSRINHDQRGLARPRVLMKTRPPAR